MATIVIIIIQRKEPHGTIFIWLILRHIYRNEVVIFIALQRAEEGSAATVDDSA